MTLYKPTFESVRYVAANMRQADVEEIHPLRFDPSPDGIAATVMSDPAYCWLAADIMPVAVFGMFNVRPKTWYAFAFGTDYFPKVAGEITKFLIRKVKPHLFNDLGARRVEAWSHPNHHQAHAWLRLLGAEGTPDPEYGPGGETYMHFVMRRGDFEVTGAEKAPRIIVSSGGKPNFASSAGSPTAPEHVPLHP